MSIQYGFEIEAKGKTKNHFEQVHENQIIQIQSLTDNNELLLKPQKADGAYTLLKDLTLNVFSADCLPLLFYAHEEDGPIGVVHAGWKGALKEIPLAMRNIFKKYTENMTVIMGPSIHVCCFEVKEDFIDAFRIENKRIDPFLTQKENRYFFNLPEYVIDSCLKGISLNVKHSVCTFCSLPKLPSYRRDHSTDPRIRGWIKRVP